MQEGTGNLEIDPTQAHWKNGHVSSWLKHSSLSWVPITGHPTLAGLRLGCSRSPPCSAVSSSLHPCVSQHILVPLTEHENRAEG